MPACRHTGTTCWGAATRRLRGAMIAFVAVAGLGAQLRLAASIGGQRPATLVHLLEAPKGGAPSEEGRIPRLQPLALARSTFPSRTPAGYSDLTLCSHDVCQQHSSASNLTAVGVEQDSARCRSHPAWAGRRPVRQRLGAAEVRDSPCRNHDDAPNRPARWDAVGASERNRWRQGFYCTRTRPAPRPASAKA
jgi:hypothetical protein